MNRCRVGMATLGVLVVAANGVLATASASPSEVAPGVYDFAVKNGPAICRDLQAGSDPQKSYILTRLNIAVGLVDVPGVDPHNDPDEVAQVIDLAVYTYCPSLRR